MDLLIEGRSFLVSGGSSGIGLATAHRLVQEGAVVTICARNTERLDYAAAELGSERVRTIQADVTSKLDSERAVATAVHHGGSLDGVAAVAGRGRHGTSAELSADQVAEEIGDKTAALLHLVHAASPHLRQVGGRIVALTAPTALEPDPAMAAVSAGRAALDNLIRSLALDLAPRGIRVNAVGVGLIDTPRQRARFVTQRPAGIAYEEWLADQARRRRVPMSRPGEADEVAAAIVFLLSP